MDVRQLEYLAALARERHFARAAAACGVTQPTLSDRIRQLEQELGVALVERGRRFHGLTPDGEQVLKWARVIIDDYQSLRQALAERREGAVGSLTVGVIPSALAPAATMIAAMRARHPGLSFRVLSQSSREIQRGLEDFSIDAGLTYLDNEPLERVVAQPLYEEHYCTFVREDHRFAGRDAVGWADVAGERLGLLTPDMQYRRIVDAAFAAAGTRPVPELETNSVVNLCAGVQSGQFVSVLPERLSGLVGVSAGLRAIPLTGPVVAHSVGVVALDRDPMPPLVAHLLAGARSIAPLDAGKTGAA